MGFPTHVAEAIDDLLGKSATPSEGVHARGGIACEGAAFHSPTPLTVVECWITPEPMSEAKNTKRFKVMLCPTCAANLRVLQSLLVASEGELPWVVRREFGNVLRGIALRGWDGFNKGVSSA